MKRYEAYKPTSVEWYPAIPQGWEWRYLFQIAHEQTIKKPVDEMYPVMTLSYGEIKRKKNTEAGLVPSNYDSYQMLYKGNIVLRLIDLQNDHTSLRTGLVKETGIITSAYTCIMPTENPAYIQYLLHSYDTKKVFYGYGGGVRQSIGFKDICHLRVPVPPREEQDQIVRYLDWQVSKINRLIAAKRKEIDWLNEHMSATINETIVGKYSPHPLVDSGFSIFGTIPEGWHVRPFSKIASIKSNLVDPEDNQEMMQVSPASVEKNTGRLLKVCTVAQSGVSSPNHKFFSGQIIYSKVRPLLNKAIIAPFDGLCSADMYPIETKLNAEYLKYYLLSSSYLQQLSMTANRVKMPKINQEEMGATLVLVPSKDEQNEIVVRIKTECSKIQLAIEKIGLQINTIIDLRTRLISDVVTGQIDVRGIKVPDNEYINNEITEEEFEEESENNEEE